MLIKTEALVLKKIPYGENSAVVHLFCQSHGILAFIFSGVQGKKGKSALLRPGTFLEIVFNFSERQNLLRAKEIKAVEPFMSEDFIASNTALICTELIRNTLPDSMPDENLFLTVKTDFSRLYHSKETDLWFLHRFIINLCESAGHGLTLHADEPYLNTGWSSGITEENNRLLLIKLCNRETPVVDRLTRRKLAEALLAFMGEAVFPGKDVRTFKVMLDVLDG
ncbi:MAG: DNA repair protein RecO [Sphingomonadales bacterium]|nr:DNA repair protein RecO [Sphingomonadales bacterium]